MTKLLCGKCSIPVAFVDEELTINDYSALCDKCFKEIQKKYDNSGKVTSNE